MVEALTTGVLTALGVAGLVAFRYALTRTAGHSLLFAAAIAVEVCVFGILLLMLTSQLFFETPWLDVDLKPLLQDAVASLLVISALGVCFWYVTRLETVGIGTRGVILFGVVTSVLVGALLIGVRISQDKSDTSTSVLTLFADDPTPSPAFTPTPTRRPTPTPAPTDVSTHLTRNPYLGDCSTESVTIAWRTDVAATSTVKYGPTPLMEFVLSNPDTRFQHAITLDGLTPGTKYYYQIISNRQAMAAPGTFTTNMSRDNSNFTFGVLGDSGSASLEQFIIASHLKDANLDFLLHTGDVVYRNEARAQLVESGLVVGYEYNPPLTEAEHWDPYFFLPYQDIIDSKCIFTSLGNHDSPKAYPDALYLPSNNPANSEFYYSFDYGRAHVIAIDANKTSSGVPGYSDTKQFVWLRTDLQEASQDPEIDWIFVFLHQAPYASGAVNINPASRGQFMADIYAPVFDEFGVDVVFGGHDHAYERTCPITKGSCAAPDQAGVLYIVTGGGGHPALHSNECGQDCPWSELRSSVFHFVNVVVNGRRLTGKAVGIDGTVFDTFTIEQTP